MINPLQELFALPIGLKPAVYMNNYMLYGSQTLNDKFIQSIKDSNRGKIIYDPVSKMVKNHQIIPVFAEKNILEYFKKRLSRDTSSGLLRVLKVFLVGKKPIEHPLDYVLAFYIFDANKIVVLISNHIHKNFSVTASDNSIAAALSHEMMHLYAHQNPYKFLSLFKEELNLYYLNFFKEVFKLKDDKMLIDSIETIYKYLFLKYEMSSDLFLSQTGLLKKLNLLKDFSNLDKKEFKKTAVDYLKVSTLVTQRNLDVLVNLVNTKYLYIVKPAFESYTISFGKQPDKGCVQELIFPSEVVCGYSDIIVDSKVKTALQSL